MKKATRTTLVAPFGRSIRPVAWVLLLTATAAGGCSCGDDTVPIEPAGGTGGAGGGGGAGPDAPLTQVTPVANAADYLTPLDAVPSADGTVVYFTAIGQTGPTAYSIPAAGGDAVMLTGDEAFVAPFGIALSTDGKTLYIADPGFEGEALGTDYGSLFTLSAEGGTPAPIMMDAGITPRSLEVMDEAGADQIYFTGRDVDGEPGVFKIAAAGGAATVLAKGPPLQDPAGITIAKTGEIYVMDTVASNRTLGTIMKVTADGTIEEFVPHIEIGYPAGLALSLGEQTLIVSAIDPVDGSSVVLQIDMVSKEAVGFPADTQFDTFFEPAGLHRARNVNVFSFVDSRANDTGTVFLLQ